jgi:hypothetical protein
MQYPLGREGVFLWDHKVFLNCKFFMNVKMPPIRTVFIKKNPPWANTQRGIFERKGEK